MNLKLMADYDCWPLWNRDDPDNIDPERLPLSPSLRDALLQWASQYDRTLNGEDPAASGFASPADEDRFDQEGRQLWQRLREELGPRYSVSHFSIRENRELL